MYWTLIKFIFLKNKKSKSKFLLIPITYILWNTKKYTHIRATTKKDYGKYITK